MAELLKPQLTPCKAAFSYTGVDYVGPFHIRQGQGKKTEKLWGVIFTCMNSRIFRLEVARSLDTDDFILVLIRFLTEEDTRRKSVWITGLTSLALNAKLKKPSNS